MSLDIKTLKIDMLVHSVSLTVSFIITKDFLLATELVTRSNKQALRMLLFAVFL